MNELPGALRDPEPTEMPTGPEDLPPAMPGEDPGSLDDDFDGGAGGDASI